MTPPLPPSSKKTGVREGWRRLQRRRKRGLALSPLTWRILAVNLIAPLMLLAGLLYLDQYEKTLVESELESLRVQAELIAAAVGEGAVSAATGMLSGTEVPITTHQLLPEQARSMVRRLGQLGEVRARLFDPNGLLVADSRRMSGPGGAVQVFDLDPPGTANFEAWLRSVYDSVGRIVGPRQRLSFYVERVVQTASDYDEVVDAIEIGVGSTMVRQLDWDSRILSAAVPVQHFKHIVGALLVSRPDTAIKQSLFDVRFAILQLFAGTLFVTVMMSLYLAGTIARPVRLLAAAAERVRSGQAQRLQAGRNGQSQTHTVIPDLSRRNDEIGDLSVSLREMTEALWQRMDAIEGFAADVAHEIKNPLTSLRSAVETVVRLTDPEKQKRLLAIIQDDVARLDRLISDISDASRLEGEMSRAELADIPCRAMLETLVDVYVLPCRERGVALHLTFDNADDPLMVRGVEDRLVQVLRNLIGNALSFSPSGGTLTLGGGRDNGLVCLTVEDDGPGIPPGKEQAIFNRFYSERPKGEKFGTHSGLGLSISLQIAESHGGTLVAENRLGPDGKGIGARFTLRLPAAATV